MIKKYKTNQLAFFGSLPLLLNPKGIIAGQERNLMVTAVILMFIVAIPVFILTYTIAWKYRAGNTKAKYAPNLEQSTKHQLTWWGIPACLILVLWVLTWKSTHALDPFKPIVSNVAPINIQVVALQWKWLFIYPQQNIATVNFVEFPSNTPVNFQLTADAPMNSFWIPQLGGQMYAMPGMATQLHLEASVPGEFAGSAAEISGSGFAGMKFIAKSTTDKDFQTWVQAVKQSPQTLSLDDYAELSKPSSDNSAAQYSLVEPYLFDAVMMKFMMPGHEIGGAQ